MSYAVQTEGIARSFGKVEAVAGIDLAIPRGEIYGFLGPNGAGKTTLVRMLITLLMPTEGGGTVAGYDIVRQSSDIRLRIGAALQDAALDPKQTGREILRLQGRLYGLSGREVDARLDDLSSLIDIGDAIDRFVGTYSGGMKRRLDLAAALIHNPEILFLDEPTTGLDPQARLLVWDKLSMLKSRGITMLLTTHYMDEAAYLCDRLVVMDYGRILAEGSPDELIRSTVGDEVIEVRTTHSEKEGLMRRLDASSFQLRVEDRADSVLIYPENGRIALDGMGISEYRVTRRPANLEDVFLRLTGRGLREE